VCVQAGQGGILSIHKGRVLGARAGRWRGGSWMVRTRGSGHRSVVGGHGHRNGAGAARGDRSSRARGRRGAADPRGRGDHRNATSGHGRRSGHRSAAGGVGRPGRHTLAQDEAPDGGCSRFATSYPPSARRQAG
jgi:hypothetical protein